MNSTLKIAGAQCDIQHDAYEHVCEQTTSEQICDANKI